MERGLVHDRLVAEHEGGKLCANFAEGTAEEFFPALAPAIRIAKNFGIDSWCVKSPDDLKSTLQAAFSCGGPALVEIPTARDAAGAFVPGWWDFPIPAYREEGQEEYLKERAEEQHL